MPRTTVNSDEYFRLLKTVSNLYGKAWPDQYSATVAEYEAYIRKVGVSFGLTTTEEIISFVEEKANESFSHFCERLKHKLTQPLDEQDIINAAHDLQSFAVDKTLGQDIWSAILSQGGTLPILTPREVYAMRNATIEEMKNIFPVYIIIRKIDGEYGYSLNVPGDDNEYTSEASELTKGITSKFAKEKLAKLTKLFERDDIFHAPTSIGIEGDELRSGYRELASAFWKWYASQDRRQTQPDKSTSLANRLPKQTFRPFARVSQAFASLETFMRSDDRNSLIQQPFDEKRRRKDPLKVIVSPMENPQYFPPVTIDELERMLLGIGANLPFTFEYTISLAIENDRVDLDLNEFIRALGLDPRSAKEREKHRRVLWECLQIFSQSSIIGRISGNYHDANGNPITQFDKSTMIVITGTSYANEKQLDKSETPTRVRFTAGDFLYRNRANRKLLAWYGDLRQLAKISAGRPAGQWARSIGLALKQHWREHLTEAQIHRVGEDSHETVKLPTITRRELFSRIRPDPNPFEILESSNPQRAREYFDAAVGILQTGEIAQLIGTPKPLDRKGWQETWLNEPLDLRPHRRNALAIEDAKIVADAAKERRKRLGRRKRTGESPSPTSGPDVMR
jgi:hypothetical protein